ncbi:glycosyltransferase [Clostridium rhizosphaerae]
MGIYILVIFFFGMYLTKYFNLNLRKYLIILFALCILTFSRATIITMVGFTIVMAIYRYLENGNVISLIRRNKKTIILGSLLFVIVLAISSNFLLAGTSFSSKIEILKLTGTFIAKSNIILNLFGVGFGNASNFLGWGAHNYVTTYYVESGALGFLGISYFLFFISKESNYKNLIIIVPFIINGFSLTLHATTFLYAATAIVCVLEKKNTNCNKDKDTRKKKNTDPFYNKTILVFPSVVWSHNWERQHELIYRFSKKTSEKIYIISPLGFVNHNFLDTIKKIQSRIFNKNKNRGNNPVSENMQFVNIKFFMPIHNNFFINKLNSFLISLYIQIKYEELYEKLESGNDKVFWCTYPNETILDFIKKYNPSLVITDLAQRRKANKSLPEYVIELEEKLVKQSNLVFADSLSTKEDYSHIKDIYYFSQGVNIERNNKTFDKIEELESISEPIIGYIGALHECIDYQLLEFLIKQNPTLRFVFVGNVVDEKASILSQYENVTFTGRKSFDELPSYMQYFKIGIIPYLVNEYTQGISPTKLFEYGIQGVPVVSTDLREVEAYANTVFVSKSNDEFNENIRKIINIDNKELSVLNQKIKDISLKNSWENKFDYFYEILLRGLNGEN